MYSSLETFPLFNTTAPHTDSFMN